MSFTPGNIEMRRLRGTTPLPYLDYDKQRCEPAMFPSNEPEWEVLSRHLVYIGKWQITKNDDVRNYRFLNRDTGLTRILTEEFVRSRGLKNTLCSLEGDMKDLERWMDDSVKSSTLIKELFPNNDYYWELSEKDFDKYDWELLKEANEIRKKMNTCKWVEVPRGDYYILKDLGSVLLSKAGLVALGSLILFILLVLL